MKKFARHIPNILSFIRILMVPLVLYLIFTDMLTEALITFVTACFTDLADGYIARKFNFISKVGMWLDPLADKLMAVGVLLAFGITGIVPLFVVIVIFLKELLMVIGGMIVVGKKRSAPSNKFGKLASFILNTSIGLAFFHNNFVNAGVPGLDTYIIYVALAFAVFAFAQYAVKNWRLMFSPLTEEEKAATEAEEK